MMKKKDLSCFYFSAIPDGMFTLIFTDSQSTAMFVMLANMGKHSVCILMYEKLNYLGLEDGYLPLIYFAPDILQYPCA